MDSDNGWVALAVQGNIPFTNPPSLSHSPLKTVGPLPGFLSLVTPPETREIGVDAPPPQTSRTTDVTTFTNQACHCPDKHPPDTPLLQCFSPCNSRHHHYNTRILLLNPAHTSMAPWPPTPRQLTGRIHNQLPNTDPTGQPLAVDLDLSPL